MTRSVSKLSTLLYLVVFCTYVYTIYYTVHRLSIPTPDPKYSYGGKAKYLTVWNIVSRYADDLFYSLRTLIFMCRCNYHENASHHDFLALRSIGELSRVA